MTLSESPALRDLRVVEVRLDPGLRLRLRELGLRDGATVRVMRRVPFGGRVVAVDGSRLALDAATASSVHVDERAGVPTPAPARTATVG